MKGKYPTMLDMEASRVLISYGKPITVNKVNSNTQRIENIDDIPSQRIENGEWTILGPSVSEKTIVSFDWPQGYKTHYWTTRIIYSHGYEIWMMQPVANEPVQLWFYKNELNVVPITDEKHLCLSFPDYDVSPDISAGIQKVYENNVTILFLAANPIDTSSEPTADRAVLTASETCRFVH